MLSFKQFLYENYKPVTVHAMLARRQVDPEYLHDIVCTHQNSSIRAKAAKHRDCRPDTISKAFDDEDDEVAAAAASNPNANASHIHDAITHTSSIVRLAGIKNKKFNDDHMWHILKNETNHSIKMAAMDKSNILSDDHIDYIHKNETHPKVLGYISRAIDLRKKLKTKQGT